MTRPPHMTMLREMLTATAVSLEVVFTGFLLGSLTGFALAVAVFTVHPVRVLVEHAVDSIRSVSAIALFPGIVVLLGIGWEARVFVIFWTAWIPVFLGTSHALSVVSTEVIEAAILETEGLNILLLIRLPVAMKDILASVRIGVSNAWISLTAAEMLGGSDGLGFQVLKYGQSFNYGTMAAYIGVIALTGYVLAQVINRIYERTDGYD